MGVRLPITGWKPRAAAAAALLAAAWLLLLIPESRPPPPAPAAGQPFLWDRDEYWRELVERFLDTRQRGCQAAAAEMDGAFGRVEKLLESLASRQPLPDDPMWGWLEAEFFSLGALVAACPRRAQNYIQLYERLRTYLKTTAVRWDPEADATHRRLYRLLYGGRIAVEEVLLQGGGATPLSPGRLEPSATPHARVLSVDIHSGDLLVSRGGAPTSALIARGSDYPGNFSHVALVHVDPETSLASIIEAHIERGVVVSRLADYLADPKLRVVVLRPRADLPALKNDPMLPHKAASHALARARAGHIPYDFAMDSRDHSTLFCSEVAFEAYEQVGLRLWPSPSHISAPGLAGWLAGFGVRNFRTLGPSMLEYDPSLVVVAEWRALEALFKEHVDNAVCDALLEAAERGMPLGHDWYLLPIARVAKAYSGLLNFLGHPGPIPEGMSATAALRNQWLSRVHRRMVDEVTRRAARFQEQKGYRPPFWELVEMARNALRQGDGV